MNQLIWRTTSERVLRGIRSVHWKMRLFVSPSARRPHKPGETSKARDRRQREGFFDRFCVGKGIDIGYGGDPVTNDCDVWETEHGDAQYLAGLHDASYDFVYSSHTLEHMHAPHIALRNWWRVVKPGGFLMLYVPDRDLYEKRKTLPSRWNPDHKIFFLLDRDEGPHTLGMLPLIKRTLNDVELIHAKRCDSKHTIDDPMRHSDGEYSIEVVLRRLA